ncbi:HvfC family RiPP maturation protein [Neptuniibacter marinus]|uniref:HvfC family RiPP maturation protein n=1 Tax=Neptuniibacter marinus TaxID=1806670 RepID=UPI000830F81C|nr:putative DNA-binding domain-containing protein [Neptuniibacter marinus]
MHKSSPDLPSFQKLQYQFSAHIRNPKDNLAPQDIEDRRMAIYRDLFFNNVEGFLSGNFPVLKLISSEQYWLNLARDFFDKHRCHTPYFLEIGKEFIEYVANEREQSLDDPVFLQELIHYEWVELALDASTVELPLADVNANGDLLLQHPVQSPLAWLLSYQFPVHCIRIDFQPETPSDTHTFLIAYRNREDEVNFMEVNSVTARLLYLLSEDDLLSGQDALMQIAKEMQHPNPEAVVEGGLETMEHLRAKGIILGTTIKSNTAVD